jgi:hypothetical protein
MLVAFQHVPGREAFCQLLAYFQRDSQLSFASLSPIVCWFTLSLKREEKEESERVREESRWRELNCQGTVA